MTNYEKVMAGLTPREGLVVDGLIRDFEENRMKESVAYEIAKLDGDGQYRLLDYRIAQGLDWSLGLVKAFLAEQAAPKEERTALWHGMDDVPPLNANVIVTYLDCDNVRRYSAEVVSMNFNDYNFHCDAWAYVPEFDLEV